MHAEISPLLNEHDVARITRLSVSTVRRWRHERAGRGPRYLKIGSTVRYRPADVAAFIDSQPVRRGRRDKHEPSTNLPADFRQISSVPPG